MQEEKTNYVKGQCERKNHRKQDNKWAAQFLYVLIRVELPFTM